MTDGDVKAAGMAGPALIGWQTLLADLSLILFMVTAAAMSSHPRTEHSRRLAVSSAAVPQLGEPLALWRAGGSQTLARWLAGQQPDARQQLTITANYPPGGAAKALATVQALIDQAGALGRAARVIVAPAAQAGGDELLASLAYDQPPEIGTARGLLYRSAIPTGRTPP